MSHYNFENITKVYWAESDGFKMGRDPMGIQNSSIATYATLLPGMTNLTGHIRYYSLYCWLLDEYGNLPKSEIENIHQYNFIRRAELIMAFIMHDKNVNAVAGSDFVLRKKEAFYEEGALNIADGADYHNKEKYWAYKSGAFGQYYLGSLLYYKLINVKDNAFYLTENEGAALCDVFKNSVSENVRNLYIKRILEGKLYIEDIEILAPAGLTSIDINSSEWEALNNLLVKSDVDELKISTYRRDSVYLMLHALNNRIPVSNFVENRYNLYNRSLTEPNAEFGWFFYYLCEALHYGIETIFCYLLHMMDNLQNPPIELLLDMATDEVLSLIPDYENNIQVKEFMESIVFSLNKTFNTLQSQIKDRQYNQAVVSAFYILGLVYKEYMNNKALADQFESNNDLKRQRGILSTGLKDYVVNHEQRNFKEYIRTIFQQVLNEHSLVAVNKMGYNDYDLRKFIIEDGCAVLVEIRYPNKTNPRINSLYNFLKDLSYISEENTLTEIGQNYIDSYGK